MPDIITCRRFSLNDAASRHALRVKRQHTMILLDVDLRDRNVDYTIGEIANDKLIVDPDVFRLAVPLNRNVKAREK